MLPKLGKLSINEVEREHIAALNYEHRETRYQANRILEVVRKMFNLAEAWGLRRDGGNPCRFVQKYKEQKRERFLTEEEFRQLGQVLNEAEAEGSETLSAVTAIRLLMLTGCRLNEIQTLRWEDVDLEAGELRLPDSKTGAWMVPLSRAAASVLSALPRDRSRPCSDGDHPAGPRIGRPVAVSFDESGDSRTAVRRDGTIVREGGGFPVRCRGHSRQARQIPPSGAPEIS